MHIRTFLFIGILSLISQIVSAEWITSDNFVKKGWFGSYNALKKAQTHEKAKDYDDAADEYEVVFQVARDPRNKARALYRKALNLRLDGSRVDAFDTYKELIERYPTEKYYTQALDDLFVLGTEYEAEGDKLFRDNRGHATEIYNYIIDTAPFYKNAAAVLLRLGNLQADSLDQETSIVSYEKLIKKYKNYQVQRSEAFIKMANVYNNMAESADQDCELTRQSLEYVNTFLETYPEHIRAGEAKKLKVKLMDRLAMYYYNLGLFYTYEANYSASATRKYLRKVLFDYTDSPAAAKAEVLLASVDPDSDIIVAEAKEKQKVAHKIEPSIQSRKMAPFNVNQQEEEWGELPVLPEVDQDKDKHLLPLPNIEEAK